MKILTKICLFCLSLLLALSLFGCFSKIDDRTDHNMVIAYDRDGAYAGFSGIPDGYTVSDAVDDGCLVIDTDHSFHDTYGYEHWEKFLDLSSRGEDAFLRVAHFIDGKGYYEDLYYTNGKYTLFALNERGVTERGSFSYLRRLNSRALDQQFKQCFYVLTDSLELTYGDVAWSFLSSNLSSVTDIPFVLLGFLVYF